MDHQQENENTIMMEENEPVRTLFIRGLPYDVKLREIYNLFRPFSNFEAASISYTGDRKLPVAFAIFSDQDSAFTAKEELQGLQFDIETNITLRIELAKSNSKTRKKISNNNNNKNSPKRRNHNYPNYTHVDTYPYMQPGSFYGDVHSYSNFSPYYDTNTYQNSNRKQFNKKSSQPQQLQQPCPTIFIGNLSPTISDNDLINIFNSLQGYEQHKTIRKDTRVMCFVNFENIQYAGNAINRIQSFNLLSSNRNIVRIEFAKNKLVIEPEQQQQQQIYNEAPYNDDINLQNDNNPSNNPSNNGNNNPQSNNGNTSNENEN